MQKLRISDYIEILKYYNQPVPKINKEGCKTIRHEGEKILAENICKRINSSDKNSAKKQSSDMNVYQTIYSN